MYSTYIHTYIHRRYRMLAPPARIDKVRGRAACGLEREVKFPNRYTPPGAVECVWQSSLPFGLTEPKFPRHVGRPSPPCNSGQEISCLLFLGRRFPGLTFRHRLWPEEGMSPFVSWLRMVRECLPRYDMGSSKQGLGRRLLLGLDLPASQA
jgi:hypothetical protein